ncbi:ATP-dependent Clp protease proteolytic subunit [Pelagicoccus sp. SDUM812002]|uniref:NfeD family protein n=1 Tax=Pelagicoccus sp. SDUM812002 TaxID=3041266 RepID=UPI00280FFF69|nr:ATP-dependent Clp protease proteolytic subunit [Pelagicoccus sp. SDUM812002]MDQ8187314.1 ATP-dependent Clp protease proteolytic subunit [Pelagicoccus sp. SDUM812002]
MIIRCCTLICLVLTAIFANSNATAQVVADEPNSVERQQASEALDTPVGDDVSKFYVIPVEGPIGPPTLFAIRGGVKTAISEGYESVVLDMNTPGGRLDSTLEIMEILDRFPGKTITYVNDEAISAGAIIAAVTDEIYFTSKAVIGSAEPVTGQGEDINESMKRKLMSYLNAKMEAYTDQYPFRSDVIRAMMDPEFEFTIGEEVISPKGELLNLTAKRAHQEYGEPPMPLLGSGIVDELDKLIGSLTMDKAPVITRFEASWSLNLAQFIVSLAPFLLAVAVISVYVEFQTPGFGVFGVIGVFFFLVAIFGHNVAGLSGHEPLLLFVVGVALLALEVFVAPGTLFFAIPGFFMMLVSLVWAMADVWPAETPDFTWTWSMFERPIQNLVGGVLMGVVGVILLARFIPKSVLWDRMVLKDAISGMSTGEAVREPVQESKSLIGAMGLAVTDLMPSGEIEVEGRRLEARLNFGSARHGAQIRVVEKSSFGYVVEVIES